MNARTENARDWLEAARPVLEGLLADAPAYGSVELRVIFHDGSLSKIGTAREELRKPSGVR